MEATNTRRIAEVEAMKLRIRNVALALFLREGIERVTIRKIAARIRYAPATIYNYYKNKDEIFLALRQDGFAKFQTYQMESRRQRSSRKRILAHGRAYLRFAIDNPQLYDLMFMMKAPMQKVAGDESLHKTQQSFQYLKDDIRSCMKEGILKKGSVDTVALAFWGIGHGLASLLIRERLIMFERTDKNGLVEQAADYLYKCTIAPLQSRNAQ